MTTPAELAAQLVEARDEFLAEVARLDATQRAAQRLVGEWGIRELVAHLGYWAGNATESIHRMEQGGAGSTPPEPSVDDINETVARVARATDLATVQRRESASVDALLERIRGLDAALLAQTLPEGDSLEHAIREDGPVHYREHLDELRRLREAANK